MQVHFAENESGQVIAGSLSVVIDGRRMAVGPGRTTLIPHGAVHRWWNEGDQTLEFHGYARPVVDLDRYLQAIFEVINAGPAGRPSLIYLAHISWRHRRTQGIAVIPRPLEAVLFPLLIAVGTLLGRYRGDDWPGCPSRCPGSRLALEENALKQSPRAT